MTNIFPEDKPYKITVEEQEEGAVMTEEKKQEKPQSKLPAGIPEPRIPSEVGEGWHSLISELDKRLSEIDPDYELDMITEKHGLMRFYINPKPNDWRGFKEMQSVIDEYEAKSARICQTCGEKNCEAH